jgi:molybdopterin biosynthesis enzyme
VVVAEVAEHTTAVQVAAGWAVQPALGRPAVQVRVVTLLPAGAVAQAAASWAEAVAILVGAAVPEALEAGAEQAVMRL